MHVYFSPEYTNAKHAFDTTRKSGQIAASLLERPIAGVEVVSPRPLTFEEIAEVHDPAYVRAVQTGLPRHLAESQGFAWDMGIWPMVAASSGGAVAAAVDALKDGVAGSLSSGLHHAHYGRGGGFCTFNGLVLAARAARAAGAKSVLILDFDAHYGDGTAALISNGTERGHVQQVDVSTGSYKGNYLDAIQRALLEAKPHYDLVLYNAGMDPYEGCDIGGSRGVSKEVLAERERLVFDWCAARKTPVAFVLAGGYKGRNLSEGALVDLHRLTISAAAQHCYQPIPSQSPPAKQPRQRRVAS